MSLRSSLGHRLGNKIIYSNRSRREIKRLPLTGTGTKATRSHYIGSPRPTLIQHSRLLSTKVAKMPHATEFDPSTYPPFPSGPSFKTVELETISLPKLLAEDAHEQDRVFEACKSRGFFYLELGGCEAGETISKGADDICGKVAEEFFKLPMELKEEQRMREGQLDGYKRVGATVTDKAGTKDTAEFFNIAKNDLTLPASQAHTMSRQWPDLIMTHQPLLDSYMRASHSTGLHILSLLATRLGIDPSELANRHRLDHKSGDLVRLTRGPPRASPEMPEIQTPSHTDFGSITVLMNWLGGLQVWSSSARRAGPLEPEGEGEWLWVKPKRGCAIVNLGDAMVKFTNGAVCSGRHRVVPAPGEQGTWPRYSVVYFVRPEDECVLERLEGMDVPALELGDGEVEERLSAREWIMKQAKGLGTRFTDN